MASTGLYQLYRKFEHERRTSAEAGANKSA
jgi:hypothetical protein